MKKFLSVLGSIVKFVGVASGFIPLVNQLAPQSAQGALATGEDKLNKSINVLVSVEQIFGAAFGPDAKLGSDKLKAAAPFVAQIIQQSDLLIGKKPKDEAKFTDAATRLTTALADILNSYGE